MKIVPMRELETGRLVLRRLGFEDVYDVYEGLLSDGEVTKYLTLEPHQDIGESLAFIEETLAGYERGDCWRWAVLRREDEALIGIVELHSLDEEAESCSFVCMLAERWWNQGYGTEVVKEVLRFAVEELGVVKITADLMAPNAAAAAVLAKAGMVPSGVIPGKFEKHGQSRDALCFELAAQRTEPLTVREYQQKAMTTLNPDLKGQELLLNAVMGLCGEAGEAIDLVKKHRFQGHELDREKLCKELGDVAWYLAEAAQALDVSLEDILRSNLEKLKKRYPQGFQAERSKNR